MVSTYFAAPAEAPANIRVIGISDESLTIEWSSPLRDGGSPITGYVIEKRESTSLIWSRVSTVGVKTTSYVFKFLDSSVSYYVRVAAENEEGVGAWLELREPVKPQKPISESPRSAAVGDFLQIHLRCTILYVLYV